MPHADYKQGITSHHVYLPFLLDNGHLGWQIRMNKLHLKRDKLDYS